MLTIDVVGDELRLLDDPVELGMLADEGDERLEPEPLRRHPVRRALHRLGDMGAGGAAHVADQSPEHLLLALEIGVEGAERDPGALGDAGDRSVVKTALAELGRGGLEQPAQGLAPALGPRLLVARSSGGARIDHDSSPRQKLNPFSGSGKAAEENRRRAASKRNGPPPRRGRATFGQMRGLTLVAAHSALIGLTALLLAI